MKLAVNLMVKALSALIVVVEVTKSGTIEVKEQGLCPSFKPRVFLPTIVLIQWILIKLSYKYYLLSSIATCPWFIVKH